MYMYTQTVVPNTSIEMDSTCKLRISIALIVLLTISESVFSASKSNSLTNPFCDTKTSITDNETKFKCLNLRTLQKYLDKSPATTTGIYIQNSNFQTVPGHAFIRFVTTLKVIDLHLCGIEVIDPSAFVGLVHLERLILWGNKLTWVPAHWFMNLPRLRVLDISFNRIKNIDYQVYKMLPSVEELYVDYNELTEVPFNTFSYMSNLKRVKFGMNPLNWAFRVYLTWQLVAQNVDFQDDWEHDWGWFMATVRECVELKEGSLPSDDVLDCVAMKLLDLADKFLGNEVPYIRCNNEVTNLLRCNSDNSTKGAAVRKSLQGLDKTFRHMEFSRGKFETT